MCAIQEGNPEALQRLEARAPQVREPCGSCLLQSLQGGHTPVAVCSNEVAGDWWQLAAIKVWLQLCINVCIVLSWAWSSRKEAWYSSLDDFD